MTRGIAHLSFPGGGMFLPARNPYDRQVLAEHVVSHTRKRGQVQVLVDGRRWMVYRRSRPRVVNCSECGFEGESVCYLISGISGDATPQCLGCAFGDLPRPTQSPPAAHRSAG